MKDPPDLDAAVGVWIGAAVVRHQLAVISSAQRPQGRVVVLGVAEEVADVHRDLAEQGGEG
jgi:hypothetical protein